MQSVAVLRRVPLVTPGCERYADATLAALAFGASILVMRHGGLFVSYPGSHRLDPTGMVVVALTTLPLLVWRRSPLLVFAVTAGANVLLAAVVHPIGVPLGPAIALYLLAAGRDETGPSLQRITVTASASLLAYIGAAGLVEATVPGFELVHAGLLWSVAWFAGERTRLRGEQIEELRRDAQRARQLAVAEERARIARDLHDSAGHAINVIAVRAGAARLRHREDPGRSLLALEAIEELARRTAEDIDHFVGVLRDRNPDSGVEAPPGLASLDTLIAQHTGSGFDVARAITGAPRPLGTAVDQAAYRILQEALTNASRHGGGSARVDISFGDAALELRVTNPVTQRPPTRRVGTGLVGMHERAALLGGTLDVEGASTTFRVCARLPYMADRS